MDKPMRSSEVDRELDKELESDDSLDNLLFGDDTDDDPTYDPSPSTSRPNISSGNYLAMERFGSNQYEQYSSDDSETVLEVRPSCSSQRPRLESRARPTFSPNINR